MMDLETSRLSYREHEWVVIRPESNDRPHLRDQATHWVCDSSSQRAVDWAGSPYRFLMDYELLAADLPTNLGGHVQKLGQPWHGHPIGAVVMTVYERDDSEAGVRVTYCVADEPHLQSSEQDWCKP